MKKHRVILLSGLLAACAIAATIAAVVTRGADPVSSPSASQAECPPVIIATPSATTTIDLEAAGPALSDERVSGAVEGEAELSTPEITWYDPYRLAEVGGIS